MIHVLGDIILDSFINGSVSRISPEAPVPVIKKEKEVFSLGGAGYVANLLNSNNIPTILWGFVGDDIESTKIKDLCNQNGIKLKTLGKTKGITTHKSRIMSYNHSYCRIDNELYQPVDFNHLTPFLSSIVENDIVIISDYNKGVCENIRFCLKQLKKIKGVKVLVDPKKQSISEYKYSYLIKPNLLEFQKFCLNKNIKIANINNTKSLVKEMIKLIESSEIDNILLTRNKFGAILVTKRGIHREYKVSNVDVNDVTGAGDTVMAFLAAEIYKGRDLQLSIETAMLAARASVSKMGTAIIKYEDFLKNNPIKKINFSHINFIIKEIKSLNKKIVFTNGCFDLLHFGHISYLNAAKSYGEILVVGVNSDNSVKKLKGVGRPIISLNDRLKMLHSLGCVDYVLPFEEISPLKLIKKISPDTLVKGGDYELDTIVGADFVIKNGGRVLTIDFKKGYSSTNIIKKIIKLYS